MRINENLTLAVKGVILVPYRREHVPLYHEWMTKPELLEATASEPLSLDEEYANQKSWHTDEKKCTFIILDATKPDTPGTGAHGGAMVGDTNLFFNNSDDPHEAEIEIMIAEPAARGRGLGRTALNMMMQFAVTQLGVRKFVARIGDANTASIQLFKSLGYQQVSHSAVFKETTFEATAEALKAALSRATEGLVTGVYEKQ